MQYPQTAIIFTCRTIAREAAHILYRSHTFELTLNRETTEPHPSARSITNFCRNIFRSYGPNSWGVAPAFQSCEFAAFLNIIGPTNAATLTSISFWGRSSDKVATCLPVTTELIARHLPNVQRLRVHIELKDPDWELAQYQDRMSLLPYLETENFRPLYDGLEDMVKRIEGLIDFEYKGQPFFTGIGDAYKKLKALEGLVKRRAGPEDIGKSSNALQLQEPSIADPWSEYRNDPFSKRQIEYYEVDI